jgi:hypothetical protein
MDNVWVSFVDNVSGEYEGVTATFNPDGGPVPLPEYYVPQVGRSPLSLPLWAPAMAPGPPP